MSERQRQEERAVRDFAEHTGIGFGRLMQLGQQLWRERLAAKGYPTGGEFTVGPCAAEMVDCQCVGTTAGTDAEFSANSAFVGCSWCCCTRKVTSHVRAMQNAVAHVVGRAKQLEESADCMMRASAGALRDGDHAGAAREQVIAAREYAWASWLYADLGDHESKMRCLQLADMVRAGEWKDPHAR